MPSAITTEPFVPPSLKDVTFCLWADSVADAHAKKWFPCIVIDRGEKRMAGFVFHPSRGLLPTHANYHIDDPELGKPTLQSHIAEEPQQGVWKYGMESEIRDEYLKKFDTLFNAINAFDARLKALEAKNKTATK